MNKLVIFGIVLVLVLTLGTYSVVGEMMGGDIVNILALAGAAAIAIITVFVVLKYIKQMQSDVATGELLEEDWGGIRERDNELPTGWAISMILIMIWGMWYMTMGYPVQSYSQIGEYNEDVAVANKKAKEKFATMTETQKLNMGSGIFSIQCAPCHGPQGTGQENYATGQLTAEDLTTRNLSKSYVEKVIREGSTQLGYEGGMPPFMLTDDENIEAVSAYVSAGFKDPEGSSKGRDLFAASCSSCHGAPLPEGVKGYKSYGEKPESDTTGVEGYSEMCVGEDCIGRGVSGVGPSLKGYNSCLVENLLRNGMKKGEIGVMPAFKDLLTPAQTEALGLFVEHGTATEITE